jgi:hypothetical protein
MIAAHHRVCLIVDPPERVTDAEFAHLYHITEPEMVAVLLGISSGAVSARAMRQGLRKGKWRRAWKAYPTQRYSRRVRDHLRLAARLEALRSGVDTLELRVGRLAG